MSKKKYLSSDQVFNKVMNKIHKKDNDISFQDSKGYLDIDEVDIKVSNLCRGIKSDVSKWNGNDFVKYVQKRYKEKTNCDLDINIRGCSREVAVLKDLILEQYKDIDNYITKAYIDFFMDYYLMKMISRGKPFFFLQLKNKRPIRQFSEKVKNIPRPKFIEKQQKKNTKKGKDSSQIKSKDIEESFLLDDLSLFLDYGFIIGLSWLISKKNKTINEAMALCINSIAKASDVNSTIEAIDKITIKYSPYPSNFVFKDINMLYKMIITQFTYSIDTNIKFNNESSSDF